VRENHTCDTRLVTSAVDEHTLLWRHQLASHNNWATLNCTQCSDWTYLVIVVYKAAQGRTSVTVSLTEHVPSREAETVALTFTVCTCELNRQINAHISTSWHFFLTFRVRRRDSVL